MKSTDRYRVQGVTCSLDGHPLEVANLSVGGLFAVSTHPPSPGQVVWVELSLDGRPPFPVMGTVTWINEREKPKTADLPEGFGLKITRIALPHKIAILDVLKRLRPVSRTTKG